MKENKKKHGVLGLLKLLIMFIVNLIIFPFKIFIKVISAIFKRFKFSIAFKISASYFILYIIIIFIVALITSSGYLANNINKFNNAIMNKATNIIKEEYPNTEKINQLVGTDNIESINIYDYNLNNVFSSEGNQEKRYSNNIIAVLEHIISQKEFVFSSKFVYNSNEYYLNINYSVAEMINDTARINILILISGAVGLLLFIPIVSRTSYKLIGPIKNMTEITKTISVNNINTRLDIKGTQDELKELSQTFNEMMERIEEGYKIQQQFVSDASHELRTPIAVIKGYVNMLDRWGKNDKAILEESITAIKNETDNMQDLIEKLLFIARNDKQTLTFTKDDFRICDILFEIEKETKIIDSKHIFEFKFYDDVSVYADKNRIKQAIRIFIDNAIKFTPENGLIKVTGYIQENYYVVKITDSGIGIGKKDLNKIFDRLYRAEQSRSKKIGGHGLGLSIAKIIILGHKGKIMVKSKLGEGSEFSIMIPYLEKL